MATYRQQDSQRIRQVSWCEAISGLKGGLCIISAIRCGVAHDVGKHDGREFIDRQSELGDVRRRLSETRLSMNFYLFDVVTQPDPEPD